MKCPKCGHINPDTAMNCEKCRINLEWAREHCEEFDERQRMEAQKRPGMEVQKRRKPLMAGVYVFFVLVGIVGLISLVYANTRDTRSPIVACVLPLGIPLLPVGLWALLWPGSAYNVLRRSSTTAQATVLRRHTETGGYWDQDGYVTTTDYYVTVQFDVARSGAPAEQMTLKAEVSKKLYDRLGPEVTVRYATEDPRIAFLQGEEVGPFSWNG